MHHFKAIQNQAKYHRKTKKKCDCLAANSSCQWELNLLQDIHVNLTWVKRAAPLGDRNAKLVGTDPANDYTWIWGANNVLQMCLWEQNPRARLLYQPPHGPRLQKFSVGHISQTIRDKQDFGHRLLLLWTLKATKNEAKHLHFVWCTQQYFDTKFLKSVISAANQSYGYFSVPKIMRATVWTLSHTWSIPKSLFCFNPFILTKLTAITLFFYDTNLATSASIHFLNKISRISIF